MIYKKQNTSRPAGRYHRARGWRFGLFSLCLAAATLISQPAWAIRVYLRSTDGSNLSGTEWRNTDGGTWHDSGESANLGGDTNARVIEFVYRGKDVYWTVNASNGQWGMPHETLVVNPHQDYSTNFYFFKYSNTLSVVTEGVLTHTNAIWSFLGPSALLTNSSAYQARYTNTHYGDGSPVETILHPMPTGTVRITFGDIVGYAKPPNVVLVVSGANPQTVTGVYARQIGDIRIFPQFEGSALTNATWSITEYPDDYPAGTPGYPLSGAGEMIIPNVPVGNYTVQFNSDAFYGDPTPPVVSKVNVQDATTDYIAVYKFTGKKLTVHVVLPSETNGNWLVGAGAVQIVPPGSSTTNAPEVFYYPADTDVTLTAIPSNVVVDGVAYKSYFFEWTGRRWNGVTWVDNELGGHGSPCRINPISLKMDNDRMVTVLFSREKYPWDNVGDLDGDGLPDEWEIMMGLSPKDSAAIHGAYGNPDGDWIPSVETNPPTFVSIIDDSNSPDGEMAGGVYWVSYDGIAGAVPGYPLRRTRMLKPQTLGVGSMMGYAGGPAFHNLLECRGFDGFYKTNGGHWTSATTFDAYWTPDDDPGTDPLSADTDNDQMTDGWEYYFWYWRSADAAARGLTASANLDWVMLHPNFANAGDWDTDGDGLTDFQEYMLGTDPTHADTDGDSMDDWWECQYDNLNPLDYSDSVDNSDADYMAVRRNLCVLEMTNGITNVVSGTLFTQNVLEGPSGEYWVDVDGDNAFTLYTDIILVGGEALSHGLIGVVVSDVYYGMAPGLPRYLPGYPVWVDTDGDGIYTTEIDIPLINPPIKHELVYMAPPEEFPEGAPGETSFSPLTAWFEGRLVSGYTLGSNQVSVTWNGPWQTERYNAYQEYLGGDYLGRLSWDAGGRVISENDDFLFPARTAFTNPNNQDTDNDGIPDGWELYVGLDPNYETDASWNHDEPLVDGEKPAFLNNREEWANLSHPLSRELAWDTKIWPTDPGAIIAPPPNDPHPADTDWDGLHDGKEREALTCPTMVDTDRDGLPDGWEVYAGVNPRLQDANEDNDHDGLLNWQEYWTGTVAEWQYCDPSWDLMFMSRKMSWWDWDLNGRTNVFLPPDFLSCPSFLYYNGIITDLELLREEFPASKSLYMEYYKTTYAGHDLLGGDNPLDSDRDGMDDFWEVFHCLNPLMGFISKMDIGVPDGDAHMPLVGIVDADPSQPGYQVGLPGRPFTNVMDLVNYFRDNVRIYEDLKDPARFGAVSDIVGPHCFGCLNNDPDNDGLPNFQEYTYYRNAHIHTCPVPLWRTNPYETNSIYRFIHRNYRSEVLKLGKDGFAVFGFGVIEYSMTRGSLPFRWAAMTEGFDTDNDMIGDYQEVTGYRTNGTVAATDPLDDQNPVRNRVLHLDGTNSWCRSYMWSHYGDFATFSVEAWARPARLTSPRDQVIVEKSSRYQVETTNGLGGGSLANFQLGIGADGAPYILFHGISGHTTQRASAASLAGQLRTNEWVHLAGVFDGSNLTLYVNGDAAATHHTTDVPARGLEGNYGIWHPNCNLSVGARELGCGGRFPVRGEKFFQGCIDEVRVWDRVLTQSEIRLRKDRELTPEEVGTILGSNRPYRQSGDNLFSYYTFNSLPDPAIDGIVPSEFPLHKRPPLAPHYNFSQIYTNKYLVIAADRIRRIPRMPSLDTRVIGTNPLATASSPDSHGINTTNYLDDITLPADFRNSANPYNFTHSLYNMDMGRGMWMCGRAQGKKPEVTWMQTLDPNDPDSTDADGDGLPDWWELLYGLDPHDATGVNGRDGDPDGDGLSNWAEYMAGTNPMKWDTDGDGLSDYNSRSDKDPYALTWGEIYDDGDGMPDTWEAEYGLDPKRDDAHLDNDNDGWSNYAEFIAGTDPSRSGSRPNPRVSGRIIYNGQKTGTYRVWGYQNESMDGPVQASQIGLDSTVSEVIGYANGTRSYNGQLPYAPVRAGTPVKISAILLWWDGVEVTCSYVTFTFTGPEAFVYHGKGKGEGAAGRLDYNTGEFELTWANDEVPWEGSEISVSYPYFDFENPMFGFSGFKEGPVYLASILDVNDNNRWDPGEPFGIAHGQPYHLGVSDLRNLRIYLHEDLPGYRRFKWNLPDYSDTNALTHVIINYTSVQGSPNKFDLHIRSPRDFFHEWDCMRYGFYGMPSGSYRWWAGAQSGTFFVNWSLPERAYAVAPRGATLYAARNQFEWAMCDNATMYHLQVARREKDGRLTMVEDKFYPAPGRDRDGIRRDYPDAYASEWGNGTYYWRVAGWNPGGHGPWSGDDLGSVQTFTINLNSSYTRTISGNIYYYGKLSVTRVVVEAFDNIGFSGVPVARVRLSVPYSTKPNKVIPFTIKGLPAGAYYVRAYVDTAPFNAQASGKWAAWKTQGFVHDNNSIYKPAMLALVTTRQLTKCKLIMRDRDMDNDKLPDAWEMEYFGDLSQTGDTDFDGDGETNYEEYRYSGGLLNPRRVDTDGDGLTDGFEIHYRSSLPRTSKLRLNPSAWDSDGDGYSDGAELRRYHTDPLDPDSFPTYRPDCYGPMPSPADIDGDGRTDVAAFDPATGIWYIYTMAGQVSRTQFGDASMTPLTGDFDGDGLSDLAIYQMASGLIKIDLNGNYLSLAGMPNMIPVPGDYDGDMFTELALYDRATGVWYIYPYGNNHSLLNVRHGGPGQIPVPGDYDGDGRTDLAVYDPATGVWSIRTWFGRNYNQQWGGRNETPVPGDYDGDGMTDLAVFNTATGMWRVSPMNGGPAVEGKFGWQGVIPIPGDYNGDGRTDPAYYYPPTAFWCVLINGQEVSGEFGPPNAVPVLGR